MIASQMADAAFTAAGALGCVGGVGLGWLLHTIRDDRKHAPEAASVHRLHTAAMCGASGTVVDDPAVALDGNLFGLCPGCGQSETPCVKVTPRQPYGPWLIDAHEPYIHPEHGLHGGECWTNKTRTGDFGLCVCGRVKAGEF